MIKEIDREEMEKLLNDGAFLVDVREEEEMEDGAIEGHQHMPLSALDDFRDELPDDRDIIFYCRSGRRSLKACEIVEDWGLSQNLFSLAGGYLRYANEDD